MHFIQVLRIVSAVLVLCAVYAHMHACEHALHIYKISIALNVRVVQIHEEQSKEKLLMIEGGHNGKSLSKSSPKALQVREVMSCLCPIRPTINPSLALSCVYLHMWACVFVVCVCLYVLAPLHACIVCCFYVCLRLCVCVFCVDL